MLVKGKNVLVTGGAQGIGREMVLATLHYARAAGARLASPQSSPDGLRVYANAGFHECCRVDIYGRKA